MLGFSLHDHVDCVIAWVGEVSFNLEYVFEDALQRKHIEVKVIHNENGSIDSLVKGEGLTKLVLLCLGN